MTIKVTSFIDHMQLYIYYTCLVQNPILQFKLMLGKYSYIIIMYNVYILEVRSTVNIVCRLGTVDSLASQSLEESDPDTGTGRATLVELSHPTTGIIFCISAGTCQ